MKKMASWLIIIFMAMFWIFRLVISYLTSMGFEPTFQPIDMTTEIIVLFVSFIAILLTIRRKLIGGIFYFLVYAYYFGLTAVQGITDIMNNKVGMSGYENIFISCIAIGLAIAAVLDLILNKDGHEGKDNENTYWFYKNKKYERKLDERADKNQYRIR